MAATAWGIANGVRLWVDGHSVLRKRPVGIVCKRCVSRNFRQKKRLHLVTSCFILPKLAGGQGFEPWLTESESVVLPLDDPPSSF